MPYHRGISDSGQMARPVTPHPIPTHSLPHKGGGGGHFPLGLCKATAVPCPYATPVYGGVSVWSDRPGYGAILFIFINRAPYLLDDGCPSIESPHPSNKSPVPGFRVGSDLARSCFPFYVLHAMIPSGE